MINASVTRWKSCVNWNEAEDWTMKEQGRSRKHRGFFPVIQTTMEVSFNTHLAHTIFCLINYPTGEIIKLKFEAVIKAALF